MCPPVQQTGTTWTWGVGLPSAVEPDALRLFKPEEVAERLGCGRAFVYQLIGDGAIRSVKVGRLRRIPADALTEFIAGLSA